MVDPLLAESIQTAIIVVLGGAAGGLAYESAKDDHDLVTYLKFVALIAVITGAYYLTSVWVTRVTP